MGLSMAAPTRTRLVSADDDALLAFVTNYSMTAER
jgi:hypothetical protein